MLLLVFRGGKEFVKCLIKSRTDFYIATSKTGYKYQKVTDKFYDSEEEKKKCLNLSDDGFIIYLVMQFAKQGYKLVGKYNDK